MIKNPCVVDQCRSNDELLRMIVIDKNTTQSSILTFVLLGNISSS